MNPNFKLMKTLKFRTFAAVVAACLTIVSCVQDDEFSVPNSLGSEENQNLNDLMSRIESGTVQMITIDQLKAQFVSDNDATEITSEIAVKGYVSSSDATGNFYKEFFIQDTSENATAAVKIALNQVESYNQFNMGREVYVYLKDLYLGEANGGDGVFTIGGAVNGDGEVEAMTANQIPMYVFRSPTTETIVAKEVTALSADDIGIFVTINDAEFPSNSAGLPYVSPMDDYDTQRTVQRCSGFDYATFMLETSAFASFKNEVLPSGGGSISGVVSKTYNGSDLVLALNTTDDVQMDGSRCELLDINDFSAIFEDDFQTYSNYSNIAGSWTNYLEEGNRKWRAKTTYDNQNSGSKIAYMSAYNTGDSSNISWLISPAIDLDAQGAEFVKFKSSNSYSDNSELELLISTDWDGTENTIETATWSTLTTNIVSDDEYYQNWVDSGLTDLSSYSGNAYIALKYTGGGNDYTGTFEIDDFQVLVQN